MNYELVHRKRNKFADDPNKKVKNEYSERTVGYFRNLTDAVERFIECVHKEKTVEFEGTLRKYCEEIKKIDKQIKQTVAEQARKVAEE